MVILEQTPTQLKLRHRPYVVWFVTSSLMLGLPFLVFVISAFLTWILYFWWLPLLFFSMFILGMVNLLFFGKIVTCTFDKDCDRLILKYRGAISTKIIQHSIAEIRDVLVETKNWNGDCSPEFQIVLLLNNGTPLHLNGTRLSWQDQEATANAIREFLGMKRQPIR